MPARHRKLGIVDEAFPANDLGFVFRRGAVRNVGDSTEVEPDLMVRQPPDDPSAGWASPPLPSLVAEAASDSTRRRDRVQKRDLYTKLGIPEYWIVDGDDRTVTIVRPGHADVVATESMSWHPAGAAEPIAIALEHVFWPPAADAAGSGE